MKTNDGFDCAKQGRGPSALSSTASESLMTTRQESQSPLSAQAEMYDRTGRAVVCSEGAHRPVVYAHSSSYSEWNVDKTASGSQQQLQASTTRERGRKERRE